MRPLYKEHDYEVYFNPIIKTFGEVYDCFGSDTEQIINSLQRKYKASSRLFEKLTTAAMLKEIFGKETTLSYTPEGRPFLKPELSISISHSKSHVAILLSKQPHVGIDIEAISSRILNLESKIKEACSLPSAYNNINDFQKTDFLTAVWTAKEAVYKSLRIQADIRILKDIHITSLNANNLPSTARTAARQEVIDVICHKHEGHFCTIVAY